ncbi:MAG: VanW family protein [Clostridia bacterium]|nr:VanW family protein [Clostridia bacterium]
MLKRLKVFVLIILSFLLIPSKTAFATPYVIKKQEYALRSSFYTSFDTSKVERSNNIALAVKSIDKAFIDVGGEFSFNKVVGERSEQRGYQKAITIQNGEFTEGVGGGVCQVSTTLYNAFILADLTVTEYHRHTLAVSYIMPSFDAMVSFGYADLKVVNNTNSPVVIRAFVVGNRIKIEIYGERLDKKIERESVVVEKLPYAVKEVFDESGEYGLVKGEQKVLSYGKEGERSIGYLKITKNGKTVKKVLRKDSYLPIDKVVCIGVKSDDKVENAKND